MDRLRPVLCRRYHVLESLQILVLSISFRTSLSIPISQMQLDILSMRSHPFHCRILRRRGRHSFYFNAPNRIELRESALSFGNHKYSIYRCGHPGLISLKNKPAKAQRLLALYPCHIFPVPGSETLLQGLHSSFQSIRCGWRWVFHSGYTCSLAEIVCVRHGGFSCLQLTLRPLSMLRNLDGCHLQYSLQKP